MDAFPALWHFVLALIAAEGNPHSRVVALLDCPLPAPHGFTVGESTAYRSDLRSASSSRGGSSSTPVSPCFTVGAGPQTRDQPPQQTRTRRRRLASRSKYSRRSPLPAAQVGQFLADARPFPRRPGGAVSGFWPMHAPSRAQVGTLFPFGMMAPTGTNPLTDAPDPPTGDFAIVEIRVGSQLCDRIFCDVHLPDAGPCRSASFTAVGVFSDCFRFRLQCPPEIGEIAICVIHRFGSCFSEWPMRAGQQHRKRTGERNQRNS